MQFTAAAIDRLPPLNACVNRDSLLRSHLGIKVFSVYLLRHPETREIRYVGIAGVWQDRKRQHGKPDRKDVPLERWKRRLFRDGVTPLFEVVFQVNSLAMARSVERELVRVLAADKGLRLLNRQGNEPETKRSLAMSR